jgi:magnesium-transporting ATPase (P-type)
MRVNFKDLTGEDCGLLRDPDSKSKNIFESGNIALAGTFCSEGSGYGLVFRTGESLFLNKIAVAV